MFCSNCGNQIKPGATFCGSCGTLSPAAAQNPAHTPARAQAASPRGQEHEQRERPPNAQGYIPQQKTELVQTGYIGADPISTKANLQNMQAPHARSPGKKSSNTAVICVIVVAAVLAIAAFSEWQFGIFASTDYIGEDAAMEAYNGRNENYREEYDNGETDRESVYPGGLNGFSEEYEGEPNRPVILTVLPGESEGNGNGLPNGQQNQIQPEPTPQPTPQLAPADRPPFSDSLGVSTTFFMDASVNRAHNIARASELLHGTVLQPGEFFSFNGAVGQRTQARGFRSAEGFIGDEAVNVLGGGVSHVSSTVYHAAILSGLEIIERHTHEFVPGFIDMGLDATVVWGTLDLRFRNNTDFPIRINAVTVGRELTVEIDGINVPGSIAIRTDVTPTATGYSVDVFRQRLDTAGNVFYEIFLYNDTYTRR